MEMFFFFFSVTCFYPVNVLSLYCTDAKVSKACFIVENSLSISSSLASVACELAMLYDRRPTLTYTVKTLTGLKMCPNRLCPKKKTQTFNRFDFAKVAPISSKRRAYLVHVSSHPLKPFSLSLGKKNCKTNL